MIVADTNLVAYLLLAGDRTPEARRVLRRDADWAAPPLWQSEFRNVLVQYLRQGTLTPEHARSVWEEAWSLLHRHEAAPHAIQVLDVAFALELSAYDAEFVAVAEALGAPLVTDDRRVLKACPAVSIGEFARGTSDVEGDADRPDAPGR